MTTNENNNISKGTCIGYNNTSVFRKARKGEKSSIICYESDPIKKTFKAIDLDTGVIIYGYWE